MPNIISKKKTGTGASRRNSTPTVDSKGTEIKVEKATSFSQQVVDNAFDNILVATNNTQLINGNFEKNAKAIAELLEGSNPKWNEATVLENKNKFFKASVYRMVELFDRLGIDLNSALAKLTVTNKLAADLEHGVYGLTRGVSLFQELTASGAKGMINAPRSEQFAFRPAVK
jgi:uncharacterized phage infection (PIP) family protein YhgE|tara:strand:+ start:41 stop:556 length:516 start_codon:yes stop_codon:yes gene_type:complete